MSNEQPVKFARRNLFKTAVAGAATVAAGGLSVAQAAAPKAGTFADNGLLLTAAFATIVFLTKPRKS